MLPILTITLNPAVDLATTTEKVFAGEKLRCSAPEFDPGGGGVNVSRAISYLGGDSRAFVALGGSTGARLAAMLGAEGVSIIPFESPGETRQGLSVTDRSTGEQYRFVLPGPVWSATMVDRALERIARAISPGGFVVLSGSQPPGVETDFALRLARLASEHDARFILDTSGGPLRRFAEDRKPGRPRAFVLRMNDVEAEELAGRSLTSRATSAEFAQHLVACGLAASVIVARGADGSVVASADECLHVAAASVPVVSSIGAGDSFVAAFTLALAMGEDRAAALSKGSAAASAAMMTAATKLCTRADTERLTPFCTVTRI